MTCKDKASYASSPPCARRMTRVLWVGLNGLSHGSSIVWFFTILKLVKSRVCSTPIAPPNTLKTVKNAYVGTERVHALACANNE